MEAPARDQANLRNATCALIAMSVTAASRAQAFEQTQLVDLEGGAHSRGRVVPSVSDVSRMKTGSPGPTVASVGVGAIVFAMMAIGSIARGQGFIQLQLGDLAGGAQSLAS